VFDLLADGFGDTLVNESGDGIIAGILANPGGLRSYENPFASTAQHVDRNQVQQFLDLEAGRMRERLRAQKKDLQEEIEEAERKLDAERQERVRDAEKARPKNIDLEFRMKRLEEEEKAVTRMQSKLRLEDGRAVLKDKRLEEKKRRK
jgi:hypothetical protein